MAVAAYLLKTYVSNKAAFCRIFIVTSTIHYTAQAKIEYLIENYDITAICA